MSHQDFEKLKAMYTQLIELVCYAKETDSEEEKYDCFLKMFQIVRACLNFSPYTHFYTQVLIDIFVINKFENCGRLFIPTTANNNPYQKARNDQKYCNNLYLDTGKTCKEIGATNKHKEKVANSDILKEYKKEYKKIYGRHYSHPKKFTEKQFKQWSKKATQLRDSFNDSQIKEFKIKLQDLSQKYWN